MTKNSRKEAIVPNPTEKIRKSKHADEECSTKLQPAFSKWQTFQKMNPQTYEDFLKENEENVASWLAPGCKDLKAYTISKYI